MKLAADYDMLEAGELYMVPVVHGSPVVGTPHIDNDHFNLTPEHFHVDSRFLSSLESAVGAISARPGISRGDLKVYDPDERATPILETRRCIRATPLPFPEGRFGIGLMSLYADFGFVTARCGVCPHKAMPILGGRCSGHRLEWLSDGTIKHKPPYTLVIRGTANHIRIEERTNTEEFQFHIVDRVTGYPNYIDMHDRDGSVFLSQRVDVGGMGIGDQFTLKR